MFKIGDKVVLVPNGVVYTVLEIPPIREGNVLYSGCYRISREGSDKTVVMHEVVMEPAP